MAMWPLGIGDVAVGVAAQARLELVLVERGPGAEIVPTELGGNAIEIGEVLALGGARLEDGVVDGDVFALGIEGAKDLVELRRAVGGGDGFEQRRGLRQVLADGVGQGARRPEEHAGVPVVVARGDKLLGAVLVGLFDKAADVEGGVVARCSRRFRCSRSRFRARVGSMPSTTMFSPAAARAMPLCRALRKRGSSAMTWSEGKTPSTASGFWRSMRKAARPQAGAVLRATGSWMICAAGTPGNWSAISWARYSLVMTQVFSRRAEGLEALDGLLDHGALAVEGQNLLGMGAAGAGPEAGAAAAGQNHGTKIDWARHGNPILLDGHHVCTGMAQHFFRTLSRLRDLRAPQTGLRRLRLRSAVRGIA